MPSAPPLFLFVDTNARCNLRCTSCQYWAQHEPVDVISIERRAAIITEFAALAPGAAVVVCGGEPLLDPEEYYAVTGQCRTLGLRCLSVSNGVLLRTIGDAERMCLFGPSELTVSLNSHLPTVHDATRGVDGSWDRAVRALRLLVEMRRLRESSIRLYVMAIVGEYNYRALDEFYDFVLNDLRADKLKLNFVQPTFGAPHSNFRDTFFADNIIRDTAQLRDVLAVCNSKYRLHLNPQWVEDVVMYYRSVVRNGDAWKGWTATGTERAICDSYDRNIMVDLHGVARLCFSPRFPGCLLRAPGDLARLWQDAEPIRAQMRGCNALCGISHSVRREPATAR